MRTFTPEEIKELLNKDISDVIYKKFYYDIETKHINGEPFDAIKITITEDKFYDD